MSSFAHNEIHTPSYHDDLRTDPVFAPLVAEGTLASPVVGTVRERFYFRRAAGPGWVLVGDAGHHKDPLIGWGIAEALVQAKQLAAAIETGRETALDRYWRQRDVDALPRFRLGEERGTPGGINPVLPVALSRVPEVPGLAQRLFRETEYDANPFELMPVQKVALWTLGAALRGRPGLIAELRSYGEASACRPAGGGRTARAARSRGRLRGRPPPQVRTPRVEARRSTANRIPQRTACRRLRQSP